MSYTFSRRDFLKYSAMTAVAVAGAGLLTGCEIQDPNNPVIKKLGYDPGHHRRPAEERG
jgi:anaerobic selenocysteine-containing dehydrogenase